MSLNFTNLKQQEVRSIEGEGIGSFITLAQEKVGKKEYRILKNSFYRTEYRRKPNLAEDKYFVVWIEYDETNPNRVLVHDINQSTNWDEIKYNYEQLIE